MTRSTKPELPIPERLNLLLLAIASIACGGLLFMASHTTSTLALISCAIVFSFTANTLFSLLHESVHGIFATNHKVNEWAGRIASAWFPTGLSVQRAFHLTHHKNNRSRFEQFDVLNEGDVKWLKYAQWYSILTGLYWAITVIGLLLFLMLPQILRVRILRAEDSKIAEQTSSQNYLSVLDDINQVNAKLELMISFLFQGILFWMLDLSVIGWLSCYAAFALSWSSLQYTDHAFSPLDAANGAWNLRVGPIGRLFFLNYHAHLAHHQNPRAPWIHLQSLIDAKAPQPLFFHVLFEAWKGPRKLSDFPHI